MGNRHGTTLAARSAASGIGHAGGRPRHCWVGGPDGERWPGLLVEWRQHGDGWQGRCVYVVQDGEQVVLVEAWVPSAHLAPA